MTPPLTGVLETALYVADLVRSQYFYETVLGPRLLVKHPGRLHAMSVADRQVLLLFQAGGAREWLATEGGMIPPYDASGRMHFAFCIDASQLEAWHAHLRGLDVALESEVSWPRGGTSLYLRDPDGHLCELMTPGCWEIY